VSKTARTSSHFHHWLGRPDTDTHYVQVDTPGLHDNRGSSGVCGAVECSVVKCSSHFTHT
jgi:hypothetical protein